MVWIDPEEEGRTRGYITDPAQERVATRAILQGVPLEKIPRAPHRMPVLARALHSRTAGPQEGPR